MSVNGSKGAGQARTLRGRMRDAETRLGELQGQVGGWNAPDGSAVPVLPLGLPPEVAMATLRCLLQAGAQEGEAGHAAREAAIYLGMRITGRERDAAERIVRA